VNDEWTVSFACGTVTAWFWRFGVRHGVVTGRGIIGRRWGGLHTGSLGMSWAGVLGGCSGSGCSMREGEIGECRRGPGRLVWGG